MHLLIFQEDHPQRCMRAAALAVLRHEISILSQTSALGHLGRVGGGLAQWMEVSLRGGLAPWMEVSLRGDVHSPDADIHMCPRRFFCELRISCSVWRQSAAMLLRTAPVGRSGVCRSFKQSLACVTGRCWVHVCLCFATVMLPPCLALPVQFVIITSRV